MIANICICVLSVCMIYVCIQVYHVCTCVAPGMCQVTLAILDTICMYVDMRHPRCSSVCWPCIQFMYMCMQVRILWIPLLQQAESLGVIHCSAIVARYVTLLTTYPLIPGNKSVHISHLVRYIQWYKLLGYCVYRTSSSYMVTTYFKSTKYVTHSDNTNHYQQEIYTKRKVGEGRERMQEVLKKGHYRTQLMRYLDGPIPIPSLILNQS